MSKRILIVLSELGYWGEELVGPLEVFDQQAYESVFMTPTGVRPRALPVSMDPTFVDPPLGKCVVSEQMAEKVKVIDNPSNPRLGQPINLSEWFPEQPYWSADKPLRAWERYYSDRDQAWNKLKGFDAMLIVGGSGPIFDLANNHQVHDVMFGFLHEDKPIAAECYGVACLAFARDLNDRKSIIWGKHVTGHCKEYDYVRNTGILRARGANEFLDLDFGPPPYPLEYILRDATGPDGGFHGNVGHETSVTVDYPFVCGRSTPDSRKTGEMLVEVLENGLRRYGW